MKALHLFAGAGGSVLAGRLLGWETVGAVEIDPFCCAVLAARGEEVVGHDVREFDGASVGAVDVVCGGFPCQDVSSAGKRAGAGAGTRSGLWREMLRVWSECGAPYLFAENVRGLLSSNEGSDLADILGALADLGADAVWTTRTAASVGAPHKRERWFLLARARRWGLPERAAAAGGEDGREPRSAGAGERPGSSGLAACGVLGNAVDARLEGRGVQRSQPHSRERIPGAPSMGRAGSPQPFVGGGAHGLANGMEWPAAGGAWPTGKGAAQHNWEPPRTVQGKDHGRVPRLKALGNGWVPHQAAAAFEYLWEQLHTEEEKP